MTSLSTLKRDLEVVQRALQGELEPRRKLGYYRLDEDTMTQREKDLVQQVREVHERITDEAMKQQNVRYCGIDYSKVRLTEEQQHLFSMYDVIFQQHAVSPVEYSRRHPIH